MLLEVTIFFNKITAQVNSIIVQRKSRLVKEIADIISQMSGIFCWKSLEQKSVNCSKPCFEDK